LVYVIHNGKARMIVYRFNTSQKQIELVEGIDLKEMRDSTSNTPGTSKPSPPTPRGSRKKP